MNSITHIGVLLSGLAGTAELSALAFGGALVLGTLLAIFRVSPIPPLAAAATVYVAVFRNVPLLVLLVLFVFGLPEIGLLLPLFASAALCMALYAAALVCEVVRSGIRTVPLGQAEAARALGLTFGQSLRHVILPQAMRSMVPPLGNILIAVVLSTSLAAAVGVAELTNGVQTLSLRYAEGLAAFGIAAVFYVTITLGSSAALSRIERRVRIRR
ncbi:amino acid ABC transporter permease [Amycolatopsis pigmentata]|uniref:Amino acid ABC transporter permease n=1 Tax=Amycolatopsis pigmentata TaxID=450801 RepID=A0ABW5G7L0_9PSEU